MVRLSIPASFAFRDLALSTVLATVEAEEPALGESSRDELTSAMCEAFNNIVLHAYEGVHGGRIDMHVRAESGEVEVHLFDNGQGFDMDEIPTPDLGELPENGMGIYIMRSFVDEVTYTRGGGGMPNVLLLRKRYADVEELGDAANIDLKIDLLAPKKETSQSGWRMRSVAVQDSNPSIAGSLRRK